MAQSRVAGRYAKALLDLASEQNLVEETFGDIKNFQNVLAKSSELTALLSNPVVSLRKKTNIFAQLFESNMNPVTFGFLKLVLQKRRESDFSNIADSFVDLYNEKKGITRVKLTTAVPVSDEMVNSIISKIKLARNIQSVELVKQINPEIIGGFIAEFDNKIIDQSIQSNLNQIKRRFSAN